MQRAFPSDYRFIPPTWVLPDDFSDLAKRFNSTGETKAIYIVKPDHLCQGRGIFLTTDFEKVKKCAADSREKDQAIVVQRYITRPMLIEGLKFDLRLYLLVCGKLCEGGTIEPRYYLFRDGLVRLCTKPYEPPTPETMDQRCMHLTNYAINKNSKSFQQNNGEDHGVGSKRSLAWFLNHVEAEFGEKERRKLWQKLMGLCTKSLLTVHPTLEAEYACTFPKDLTGGQMGCRCFEVLGVDVMLDAKRKPYIIEVNHLPSFTCDSPLDEDIKMRLISQTMDLTCSTISCKDKRTYEQLVRERREGGGTIVATDGPSPNDDGAALLDGTSYKDFERCYPPPAEAPKLAAQCEAILSKVREVFRPVQTTRRPRPASQEPGQDAVQPSAPRPPPLPRPPNGAPSGSSSAASTATNATASTRAGGSSSSAVSSSSNGTSSAKKRSRSAPGPPRCALPPISRFSSPRIVRPASANPSPDEGSEVDTGTAPAKPGAMVRVPSRQRVFLPLKSAQILL
jgi:tubulin polyglutamylase TTLL6/13